MSLDHANMCSCRSRDATIGGSAMPLTAATSRSSRRLPRSSPPSTSRTRSIALLVIEREPHNGERAAVRWIGRLCLERRDVTLVLARDALDAFTALVEDPDRAEAALRRLANLYLFPVGTTAAKLAPHARRGKYK